MIYNFKENKLPSILKIGGKAKALIETTKAGFPVPEGIVLSVDFFELWLEKIKKSDEFSSVLTDTTKENCDVLKSLSLKLRFNDKQKSDFEDCIKDLEGNVFAVRSSSPEEDLDGTSFAGMYETYLGNKRIDLEESIALAFSSCFDYRVMLYKKQNNLSLENTSIAIIVQRQIASDVSGVGFSLNPLDNSFDEVFINASFGLGEAIVSGLVSPDTYIYDYVKEEIIEKKINKKEIKLSLNSDGGIFEEKNINKEEQALTDKQIVDLSILIKDCERHYCKPMDIEWAYENEKLYLLQSRPITTHFPLFDELLTKPGEAKRFYIDLLMMTQGISEPMSVLGMDVWSKLIFVSKSGLLSTPINGTTPVINGKEYLSVTAYQKVLGKKNGRKALDTYDGNIKKIFDSVDLEMHAFEGKPEGTEGYIGRSLKKAFKILPHLLKAYTSDPKKIVSEYKIHADEYSKVLTKLNSGTSLARSVEQVMDNIAMFLGNSTPIFAGMIAQQSLKKLFKGCDIDSELAALNMNLEGNPTSEMGKLLFSMACTDEFKVTESKDEFIEKIEKNTFSDSFMQFYNEFMLMYSSRGFKEIDVASKRIYEDIGMLYDKLKEIITSDNQNLIVESKRNKAYNKLLELARSKNCEKKFIKAAAKLKATFGYREYPKYMIVNAFSILHKICLEIGKEWLDKGRIEEVYQIFDLSITDISEAQVNPSFDIQNARNKNLKGYEKVKNTKIWPLVIDSRGKIYKAKLEINDGDIIGDSIAPGIIRGKVKILHSPYEKSLEPGEILVVRTTEPSWTPIFTNAAGVIMEIGGPLQHGGIIAREYGIPCVSSLVGIMDILKDGDMVEVDGNSGIVRLL
jgi:pyruvate,water dikinase